MLKQSVGEIEEKEQNEKWHSAIYKLNDTSPKQ